MAMWPQVCVDWTTQLFSRFNFDILGILLFVLELCPFCACLYLIGPSIVKAGYWLVTVFRNITTTLT